MSEDLWPVKWPSTFNIEDYDAGDIHRATQTAVNTLRLLTLNRVGGINVTARPCGRTSLNTYSEFAVHLPRSATFQYTSECVCHTGCGCHGSRSVKLLAPVQTVTSVTVDGEELDPDTYWVDGGAWLVRTEGYWPVCSRGFIVEYVAGYRVPTDGQYAAGALAEEFLRGIHNPKNCRLPRGVTDLSRQGVTISVEAGLFPDGMTGLPEVDGFIYQWNPYGLTTRPRVYSPDMPRSGASW